MTSSLKNLWAGLKSLRLFSRGMAKFASPKSTKRIRPTCLRYKLNWTPQIKVHCRTQRCWVSNLTLVQRPSSNILSPVWVLKILTSKHLFSLKKIWTQRCLLRQDQSSRKTKLQLELIKALRFSEDSFKIRDKLKRVKESVGSIREGCNPTDRIFWT